MDQWTDWPAFGFLALLTLLDGLRRVPAGALVLRKVVGGTWKVVEFRPGYRLVSWWPPLTTTLIVAPGTKPSGRHGENRSADLERGLERVRRDATFLLISGAVSLVSLVGGLPLAMRWWGAMGFLAGLMVVGFFALLAAGASYYAGGKLRLATRERLAFALPRLNPFASPGAGEALLERALEGTQPVAVARLLMTAAEFERWIRPRAFDAVQGTKAPGSDELVNVMGFRQLRDLVAARPPGVAAVSPWCPRCGSEFGPSAHRCATCEVDLIP